MGGRSEGVSRVFDAAVVSRVGKKILAEREKSLDVMARRSHTAFSVDRSMESRPILV